MNRDREQVEQALLILRSQRGDRQSFEALVQRWEKKLFFFIAQLVDNEEDRWQILQDVWLHVLRNLSTLREPDRFPGWIYTIARNLAMTCHRESYSRREIPGGEELLALSDEEERGLHDKIDLVGHGLSRIPLVDREVLTLFFLDDLSIDQVAEVLKIPAGTVKSRLFKAKKSLREVLEREERNHD